MKKIIGCVLTLCFCFFYTSLFAQKQNTKLIGVGLALEGGLPGGNTGNGLDGTIGGNVRLAYRLSPGFVTATFGVTGYFGLTNDEARASSGQGYYAGGIIELSAGYKYFLQKRFFVMGEIGVAKEFLNHNADGTTHGVQHVGVTFAPSAGAQFGFFEVGLKYQIFTVPGGNLSSIGLRLGLDF